MDGVFPAMPDDTNSIADEAEEKDDEEDEGEQGQEDNSTEESSDQPVTINLDPNTIQAVADAVLKGFQSNDGSGRPYPVPTTARPKDHQPDAFTQIADALRNAVVGDHSK